MGNLEKLVVLTVFFLAGVVLAVSMNSGSPALAGGTPAEDLGRRVDGSELGRVERPTPVGPSTVATGAEVPARPTAGELLDGEELASAAAPPSGPTGLLSAIGERELPAPGLLRQMDGLVPTLSDRFMSYTCRAGDTFASLAGAFYGATEYAAALRQANSDVLTLAAGVQLTVPTDARPTPPRAESLPAQPVRRAPTATSAGAVELAEDVDGQLGTEFREHVLARGETLSHVAERYYGRKDLWTRIFDANSDVIDDPDRVGEGTVLRIP